MPPDSRAQDRAGQLCLQSAGKAGIIKAQHAAGLLPCPVACIAFMRMILRTNVKVHEK